MAENLFDHALQKDLARSGPLAARMRPQTLADIVGQKDIIGPGSVLRQAILSDRLFSMIFYGPPGSGKTTLAGVVASQSHSHFAELSAVTAGVSDVKQVLAQARERRSFYRQKTILFIDEIHRFNKAQQDSLLPSVENGLIILIGSTTENPFFAINRPLISRCRLYRFEPLTAEDILLLLKKALADKERGLGQLELTVEDGVLEYLAQSSNGDARTALNALELASLSAPSDGGGPKRVTLAGAVEAARERVLQYNREDEHYDVVSAWIKSMRGSDAQAAVYYLARLIYAGEDINFLARRLMILASEDVGLADPGAITVAASCAQAVERIGLPEARIVLAEAAIYLCRAPKSNSVIMAIDSAMEAVRSEKTPHVPAHLRDSHYSGARSLGHGDGYLYPHSYPGHWVEQEYLPAELKDRVFYQPSGQGLDRGKQD